MELGYFAFPSHPINKDYSKCLAEDRDSIILAEKLGFSEAFIGEHLTDKTERVTSSLNFISSLINCTSRIRLGTGTINLPNHNPINIAAQVSMLDHMSKGRFIMGIGPGSLISDSEAFNNIDKNRNEMFLENINFILKLWKKKGPINLDGKYWKISTLKTFNKKLGLGNIPTPYQRPHPEIVVTSLGSNPEGLNKAINRGWNVMSSNFLIKSKLIQQNLIFSNNSRKDINWRVAKFIFVSEKKKEISDYGLSKKGPIFKCFKQIFEKLKIYNKLNIFKNELLDSNEKIDINRVFEDLIIVGDVKKVVDKLQELKECLPNMKTLTYVNVDWQIPEISKQSMKLLSEKVIPKI